MKKIICFAIAAMMLVTVLVGCSGNANYERGTVNGSTYTNTSAGLKYEVPYPLEICSPSELGFYGNDVTDCEYAAANQETGENIILLTEKLPSSGYSTDDYIRNFKASAYSNPSNNGIVFQATKKSTYNGVEFMEMDSVTNRENITIYQRYLFKKVGDTMMIFMFTAADSSYLDYFTQSFEKIN